MVVIVKQHVEWESQQRMFLEAWQCMQGKVGKVHEVASSPVSHGAYEYGSQTEWFSIADDTRMIDAVDQKCSKCGSRKHVTSECQTDVSKLACFRCGEKGLTVRRSRRHRQEKVGSSTVRILKDLRVRLQKASKVSKVSLDRGKGKGKKGRKAS